MKNKYSIFSLVKNAFSYNENWQKAWKDPTVKKEYDAVIIGGGGHGFSGPGGGPFDVAPIRGPDEEGQSARLWKAYTVELKNWFWSSLRELSHEGSCFG